MKTLLKVMIALVAVAVLAVLFVRSARSTRAQPFTIARQHLTGWTLTLAPDADPLGSSLSITPKAELMPPLARDLFARMGESLHYPPPAMPVVLRSEFQRAIAGVLTPEALLDAAREAGLESATFQPRCMARRARQCTGRRSRRLLPLVRSAAVHPFPRAGCAASCVPPAVTRRCSIRRRCRLS